MSHQSPSLRAASAVPAAAPPARAVRRVPALMGAGLVAATWGYLVLARPTDWGGIASSGAPALITLIGYVAGAVLLLAATLPGLPVRTVAIIPVALVLNIVIGEIVGSTGLPVYLDSVGTVLVAALAGPAAGVATGTLSSVIWGLINPAALPFAAVSALTGWLAGVAVRRGALAKVWRAVLAGLAIGICCAVIAAPVAAFVYGGTAGLGTGAVVSLFREMGQSLLASVTTQALLSDPLDKAIVMALVWAAVSALPRRTREALAPREATR